MAGDDQRDPAQHLRLHVVSQLRSHRPRGGRVLQRVRRHDRHVSPGGDGGQHPWGSHRTVLHRQVGHQGYPIMLTQRSDIQSLIKGRNEIWLQYADPGSSGQRSLNIPGLRGEAGASH